MLGGRGDRTGASILADAFDGLQLWGELFEVPLMSAMFLAMVWHARRRVDALATVEALADERAALLEQEERLLHDVSHELRTPVTIARGHLELLAAATRRGPARARRWHSTSSQRIERIVERMLLLARAERPDCVVLTARSRSCHSSKTCSCAGRRSRRARGGSARSST